MITYLLGAGASAKGCMPVVREIPNKIQEAINLLNLHEADKTVDPEFDTFKDTLIQDLEWLYQQSQKFSSVDTFAKHLILSNNGAGYGRFKNAFSAFWGLIQIDCIRNDNGEIIRKIDNRYIDFLSGIINMNGTEFPDNIRIVSWNYDHQFIRAYKILKGGNGNIDPFFIPKGEHKHWYPGFKIMNINGVAGLVNRENRVQSFYPCDNRPGSNQITDVVRYFMEVSKQDKRTNLSFAWEDSAFPNQVKDEIKDSEILVVIGYSLPFYNRAIDRMLFGDLKLKKIYFQSPEAELHSQRLLAVNPNYKSIIELITDTDQFHLPVEM